MLSTLFPDKVSQYVAKVEMALSFGLIIGPVFGTALMRIGSFPLPFFTFAGLNIVLFLLSFVFLPGKRLSSEKKIADEQYLIN